MKCPVCAEDSNSFSQDHFRRYLICPSCELVFVPRDELISEHEEKERYQHHQEDANYAHYLRQIRDVILPYVEGDGLDFGCGQTTGLAKAFKEKFFTVDSYDLFFHPREEVWKKKYDFIVLSEVIEHLRSPLVTMERLNEILKPQGRFFIKTKFRPKDFDTWFYKRDATHVQFFNPRSMEALADRLGKKLKVLAGDVSLIADHV